MLDIPDITFKEEELTETMTFAVTNLDEEEEISEEELSPIELGRIDREEIIGQGGMGIIFSGQQHYPPRKVAIKLFQGERKSLQLRLLKEAMITGRLSHPNIPPVYQIRKNEQNRPEVVFRKIEGQTLQQMLEDDGSDKGKQTAIQLLIQVCYAVEYAHSVGILHRDIKPENIMIGKFNEVYLMDWGIAVDINNVEEAEIGFVGTPAYMSPEMLYGNPKKISASTDIYLLGATLHKILTGKRRNIGISMKEIAGFLRTCKPFLYSRNIPEMLADLCNQSCSKNLEDRPKSVAQFRKTLEEYLYHREALELVDRGKQKLKQYQTVMKKGTIYLSTAQGLHFDQISLHKTSEKAKNLFEQALELRPDLQEAQEGLNAITALMIERAIDTQEFQRAEILFEEFGAKESRPDLKEEIASAKQKRKEEKKQLAQLQQRNIDFDPSETIAPRFILRSIFFCSLLLGVVLFGGVQFLGLVEIQPKHRVFLVYVPVLPIWIGIAVLYSRLTVNTFGKRSTLLIFLLTLTAVGNLTLGWALDIPARVTDVLGCFFVGIIMVSFVPVIRRGFLLGAIFFLLALLGVFFTEQSLYFSHIMHLLVAGEIFIDWGREKYLSETQR